MIRRGPLVIAIVAGLLVGGLLLALVGGAKWFRSGPDAEAVASASLQSVREQARLTPFVARYVAVVTATQRRYGLSAQKTIIMPGTVRYDIDLAKLGDDDLAWDAAAKRLTVTLPPIELAGPEIDLGAVQEYSGGGVLMRLTDAEAALDTANRRAAQKSLLDQARGPVPMRMARDAARKAVARSFALPLGAAGIEATVVARFADEAGADDPSWLDRSRRMEDVLAEETAKQ
ncbi:DUF4230 domain-containing protein [Allosphingosinicella indica]|uniref:DUF4230 domain-containing protein n=1 Tax=Allosphingosinicella indica TaxID=941907 RepID=A0A1X7H154_9SPHN|nr:DUF4230 domain-containing protein [Allosphingosinicella indica]SMF77631.1 Protein of unknown function [Allosphingosinicella indica]